MTIKIKNIILGWGKRFGVFPVSEAEAKLSELRMKQCANCEHAVTSQVLQLIAPDEWGTTDMLKCNICKCPCKVKSLVVLENCPVGRW